MKRMQVSTDAALEEKDTNIEQLERELATCQETLQRLQHSVLSELQLPLSLMWRRGQDMPFEMNYHPGAVVLRGKVYVGGGSTTFMKSNTVMVYDTQRDDWSTLPQYLFKWFSLAIVNGQLVLVGGVDGTDKMTKKLGVWNERVRKWTNPYPPMLTERTGALVVSTHINNNSDSWLVVAGGYSSNSGGCSTVEVLNTSTKLWYSGPPLPTPMYKMSSAVIGHTWYLLGGRDLLSMSTVLCTSLDDLIFKTILHAADQSGSTPPTDSTKSPWRVLCDSPSERCTALALRGALLAVGGSAIFLYKPGTNSWTRIGEMPSERRECTCTVLPSGEVFIVGGYTHHVDICTLKNT